jgi:SAM-dependent methyltransferase
MDQAVRLSEIERSRSEAQKTTLRSVDLRRYENPSEQTPYALEYAFHLLGNVEDRRVLDLGCGSGENVLPLLHRGARVVGLDLSPDLVELALRRTAQQNPTIFEIRVGSAYETGLLSQSMDVVFSMSILHHLDLARAKREICRVLRPEGLWILKEPIRFSPTIGKLRTLLPAKQDISEDEYPLDQEQLRFLTDGFHVVASRSFRTPLTAVLAKAGWPAGRTIHELDASLLRRFPALDYFATLRVMAMRKVR